MSESANNPRIAAVTGAGGFIGSHLVEDLLGAGWQVRALIHYNALGRRGHLEEVLGKLDDDAKARLEIVAGDVQDARCMREFVGGAEVLLHLAALIGIPYSYTAPESYVSININGTLNILEACRDAAIPRLIHTSTSEVYGTAISTPMHEKHPLQAQSPYSATKIAADKLCEAYARSYDMPITIVRPFNTFGPRQSLRAVLPTIIAQALSKDCKEVRLGSLDPVRDLTFVADTAAAFRMVAEAPAEKVRRRLFNLGVGKGLSIGNLAQRVLEVLKVEKPIAAEEARERPAASEVQTLISDNSRIRQELGWKPQVSIEDGIKLTAEWIKPRLKDIRPQEYHR